MPRHEEVYELGRLVLCDECNTDYTDRPDSGGLIFGSHGVCPACAPEMLKSIKKFSEEEHIKATCPPGTSFADFVRGYRGPDAVVKVTTFS